MKETIIVTGPLARALNEIHGYNYFKIKKEVDEITNNVLHTFLKWLWIPGIIFLLNFFIWFDRVFIAPVALVNISSHISPLIWKILASIGSIYLFIFILFVIGFSRSNKQ